MIQGSQIEENKPVRLTYCKQQPKSRGAFTKHISNIYASSDPNNVGGPLYDDPRKSLVAKRVIGRHITDTACVSGV